MTSVIVTAVFVHALGMEKHKPFHSASYGRFNAEISNSDVPVASLESPRRRAVFKIMKKCASYFKKLKVKLH